MAGEAVSISDAQSNKVCIVARQDTWSRSARRKARTALPNPDLPNGEKGAEGGGDEKEDERNQPHILLVVDVWVDEHVGDASESKDVHLVVQWKRGHDAQAFEGFASHVGRKMREATEAEVEVTV